jgi:hypothetical protein
MLLLLVTLAFGNRWIRRPVADLFRRGSTCRVSTVCKLPSGKKILLPESPTKNETTRRNGRVAQYL